MVEGINENVVEKSFGVKMENVLKHGSVGIEVDLKKALVSRIISWSTYYISSKSTTALDFSRVVIDI